MPNDQAMTTARVLHLLRNPWGHDEDALRAARLAAADRLEQAARLEADAAALREFAEHVFAHMQENEDGTATMPLDEWLNHHAVQQAASIIGLSPKPDLLARLERAETALAMNKSAVTDLSGKLYDQTARADRLAAALERLKVQFSLWEQEADAQANEARSESAASEAIGRADAYQRCADAITAEQAELAELCVCNGSGESGPDQTCLVCGGSGALLGIGK